METAAQVCEAVKKKIIPSNRMRRLVESRSEEIRRAVERECGKAGLTAEVRLDGSVAKDTWISDYVDADIFMRVSPALTKKQLQDVCLPIAKKALRPQKTVERFAEHPYVESLVEFSGGSLRVNVVPCYNVQRGNWLSATDRTPYHTEYVRGHLDRQKRDEVRLLKAFMRGIGAYGADIKTGGFSGMICETLIISRHTFLNVLEEFTGWREDQYIDVEKYYEGRGQEIHRAFLDPLVVVDPVDKGRNLGAAVRSNQLWNFVAASRSFLEKPSPSYFTKRVLQPLTTQQFRAQVRKRGSQILCVAMGRIDVVVDILWSQLYRSERALKHLLENNDFQVIRSAAWTDEKELNVIIFDLCSNQLPSSRKHGGPPVTRVSESSSFILKHLGQKDTISGPWIEGDRWFVQKRRAVTSARTLLSSTIQSGGANVGVAPLIVQVFRRAKVFEQDKVGRLLKNREFARFMREFLTGRPPWLAPY